MRLQLMLSCAISRRFHSRICASCARRSIRSYTFSDRIRNRRKVLTEQARVERHPDLFDRDIRSIAMPRDQKQHLVSLIGSLLIEIATTISMPMTEREGNDDKDHT
jgi:hypothetical protein